jgi:hypothetical protein
LKLIIGLAALILVSSHQPPQGYSGHGTDNNPGFVDDPGCRALIKNQMRDSGDNPKKYTIEYTDTTEMTDHAGGMNVYTVTEKATGIKTTAIVAIHFGSTIPYPLPTPTPSPSPAGLRLQI